ncbi:hypothetical protein [Paenibacillus apis]|uniref:Uncharacterized protein n=1 Tax=Paenibacillus apis TaxID=1792174 RepID=A0A919Y0S4_9BACL|nr:hypothetical protein [Paenibacillus apis]GIO40335.1 hypothetical protein J41TS4_00930 [Paenibacillus apis]
MELIKHKEVSYSIKKTSKLLKKEMERFIEIQEELNSFHKYLLGKGE